MNRSTNTALAACVALVLTLSLIGAIVTVPPARAASPTALGLPVLA